MALATLVARNADEATTATMVGSGGVSVWQESGFTLSQDTCEFCTFSDIYKDNSTINCIDTTVNE
jgi:H+/gluconate symporter-like permease